MKKQIGLAIVLLAAAIVLGACAWPEKKEIGVLRTVESSTADEAVEFSKMLLDLASKHKPKDFLTHVLYADNETIPLYYNIMRGTKVDDEKSWSVARESRDSNNYFVTIVAKNNNYYRIVVANSNGEWKFVGLYEE